MGRVNGSMAREIEVFRKRDMREATQVDVRAGYVRRRDVRGSFERVDDDDGSCEVSDRRTGSSVESASLQRDGKEGGMQHFQGAAACKMRRTKETLNIDNVHRPRRENRPLPRRRRLLLTDRCGALETSCARARRRAKPDE